MTKIRTAACLGIALSLIGCSHAGNAPAVPATSPKTSQPTAKVAFKLVVSKSAAMNSRRPQYVSTATKAVSIGINGGTPAAFNFTGSAMTVDAPVGNDTFTVSTFDQPLSPAGATTGTMLSAGTIAYTVVAGTYNSVPVTLNGVLSSFTVSVPNDTLAAGTPGSSAVVVTALDPDGNAIVGPGSYIDAQGNPLSITLSSDNACSCTTLTNSSISSPGQTGTLSYNGTPPLGVYPTITATLGTTHATTLAIINAYITHFPTQGAVLSLAFAPDGTLWFPETPYSGSVFYGYGRFNPATQNLTETANSDYTLHGVNAGNDGNMWFEATPTASGAGYFGSGFLKVPVAGGAATFVQVPATDIYNGYVLNNVNAIVKAGDGRLFALSAARIAGSSTISPSTAATSTVSMSGGTLTAFDFPDPPGAPSGAEASVLPFDGALGSDQNLYIVQRYERYGSYVTGSGVWRFNPASGFSGFVSLPAPESGQLSDAYAITTGHDGNLWISAGEVPPDGSVPGSNLKMIYKVTPGGTVTTSPLPLWNGKQVVAGGIAAPPGAYQWAFSAGAVGDLPTVLTRIDNSGKVLYVPLRRSGGPCDAYCGGGGAYPMIAGPDGLLYSGDPYGFAQIKY